MTTPDLLYVAVIAIALLLDHFALWPAFLRRSHADPGRARVWLWSRWMSMLWTLVAAGVALWVFEARAWRSLRLIVPQGWRLLGAIGLVSVLAITYTRTAVKVARSSRSRRIRVQKQFGSVAVALPHTQYELGWFVALSLSAGFCEEFIFRGYLIWAFQWVLGLWGAAALSAVVFTAAHAYQGPKGMAGAGIAGSLLTVVVLTSGSLFPAIASHAILDIGQGVLAWLVLREVPDAAETVAQLDE
jgi:membrane protease YdiL (CAAX protease family)